MPAASLTGLLMLPQLSDLRFQSQGYHCQLGALAEVLAQLTGLTRLSMWGGGGERRATTNVPAAICGLTALQLLEFQGQPSA